MTMREIKAEFLPGNSAPTNSSNNMHPAIEDALIKNRSAFLGFLTRRIGNKDTAEDVLQQFYLRVVRKSSELRTAESVVAWLYAVLRNVLVDHFRKETNRRNRETEYAQMQALVEESCHPEPKDRICDCLMRVIPTLKPEYSDMLRRVDLDEMPPRKVARDLGLTSNNVRVRLYRARNALKHALLKTCPIDTGHGCLECECDDAQFDAVPIDRNQVLSFGVSP